MSSERRERLLKLMELRDKQLGDRVAELGSARQIEDQTVRELCEAQTKKMHAIAERDERARAAVAADDWGAAERWLTQLAERELAVELRRQKAARAVVEARTRVVAAKAEKEKIAFLIRNAVEEAKQMQKRADRKLEDEFATRAATRKTQAV